MVHKKTEKFKCDKCDYTCYRTRELNLHIDRIHKKIKLFNCDKCIYTSVTQKELDNHIHFNHTYKKTKGSLGEKKICEILDDENIDYQFDQTFDKLSKFSNKELRFDFIIPMDNETYKFIEYDGKQHFQSIKFFGGDEKFNEIKKNDAVKNNFCKQYNYDLLRVNKSDWSNLDEKIRLFLNK